MRGIIISGTGKGAYFVRLYSSVFQQKLGFAAFPGTLNLKVLKAPPLDHKKKISLTTEGYGQVDCYPIFIQKTYKGYLLRPHKTTHPDTILEILSDVNLKERLHLQDGDELECELA